MYFDSALRAMRSGKVVIFNDVLLYKIENESFFMKNINKSQDWERVGTFYANDLQNRSWKIHEKH